MTHSPKSTTHFVCNERMDNICRDGVVCCACCSHECEIHPVGSLGMSLTADLKATNLKP